MVKKAKILDKIGIQTFRSEKKGIVGSIRWFNTPYRKRIARKCIDKT